MDFLRKPKEFTGREERNPKSWLQHIELIKDAISATDQEAILIAASHLTDRAAAWWHAYDDHLLRYDWNNFRTLFLSQFAAQDYDDLWDEIESRRQQENETVDDVAYSLVELFDLVGVRSISYCRRAFIRAIKPTIAWELKRSDLVNIGWLPMVREARRIERLQEKYKAKRSAPKENSAA